MRSELLVRPGAPRAYLAVVDHDAHHAPAIRHDDVVEGDGFMAPGAHRVVDALVEGRKGGGALVARERVRVGVEGRGEEPAAGVWAAEQAAGAQRRALRLLGVAGGVGRPFPDEPVGGMVRGRRGQAVRRGHGAVSQAQEEEDDGDAHAERQVRPLEQDGERHGRGRPGRKE